MKKFISPLMSILLLSVTSLSAQASLITYTDETAYNSATSAFTFVLEDFESSTAGLLSKGTQHSFTGFTAQADDNTTGSNNEGFEIYPSGFSGSQHAPFTTSQYLGWSENTPNFAGTGDFGVTVSLDFATPLQAISFDFLDSDGTDEYNLLVNGVDVSSFLSTSSTFDDSFFFGLVDTAGITSVVFSADSTNPGGFTEEFGIDNVSTSALPSTSVPEPSTLAIFGLALLGLATRKIKKS
jgi:hypothetical protein